MDMLILAMKPKDAETALESLKPHIQRPAGSCLSLRVKQLAEDMSHEGHLRDEGQGRIRHTIGASATALCAGRYVKDDHISMSQALYLKCGEVYTIWWKNKWIFLLNVAD
ncbi:hypothetical protein ACEQPO_16005 [Bacillus sp. SL00103]